MSNSMEIDILKQRLDVMQKEMREVLTVVNADFTKVASSVISALNAMDARIERLEQHAGLGTITAALPDREEGKEL